MKTTSKVALYLALLAMVPLSGATRAEEAKPPAWEFVLAPYLWGSALDGNVTARGVSAAVDQSFGDVVDVLDGAGLLHFEAGKGSWVILADAIYLDLGQEFDVVPGELDLEQGIFEAAGGYRVAEGVELLFGARYTSVDTELRFSGPLGMRFGGKESWIDPVFGVRWQPQLSKRLSAYLRGDMGGLGVGSDLVWQLRAGLQVRASKLITVGLGYRVMDYDYESGAGSNLFEYKLQLSGAEIGVGFHF